MKKRWMAMLLSVLMLAMLWIPASAAGERAYFGIDVKSATATANGEKLEVKYDGAVDGSYYIVLLVKKGANLSSLSDSDIYYIDQKTASGTSVSFTVYPTLPESGNIDFDLYITTNAGGGATVASGTLSYGEEGSGGILGDVNNDGSVNAKDRAYLARAVALWEGYTVDVKTADLNNDGVVNAKDRAILARHVAKWADYLTLPYTK